MKNYLSININELYKIEKENEQKKRRAAGNFPV
jgi:hypothetical protein